MNNNSEFMPVECLNVPKVLFYDKQYEDLSMDAKLIYALLLDRKEMAIRNEWVDEYGDTYVIYPKQAENDHWNVHYTLPGDTSNLDKQFISKDEALQDVYEMDIWRRNRWKFLPMKELRTRLKKLLMEAGFTQAELAEMVENCKDNIRRLERNKFINPTYQLHHDFTEFFENLWKKFWDMKKYKIEGWCIAEVKLLMHQPFKISQLLFQKFLRWIRK